MTLCLNFCLHINIDIDLNAGSYVFDAQDFVGEDTQIPCLMSPPQCSNETRAIVVKRCIDVCLCRSIVESEQGKRWQRLRWPDLCVLCSALKPNSSCAARLNNTRMCLCLLVSSVTANSLSMRPLLKTLGWIPVFCGTQFICFCRSWSWLVS